MQEILEQVNQNHRTRYVLVHRLAGGMQNGAFLLQTPDGSNAVLKWNSRGRQIQSAALIVELARSHGWPTPAWLAAGETRGGGHYHVQEFVEGSSAKRVDVGLIRAILPIISLQSGMNPRTTQDWSHYDYHVVFDGRPGIISTIEGFSVNSSILSEYIRDFVAPYRQTVLPVCDLVHGDLNPTNILLRDGKLVSLIDAEALGRGSRLHDLATLLMNAWTPDIDRQAVDLLLNYIYLVALPGEAEISLASCIMALMAFVIGHNAELAEILAPRFVQLLRYIS